MRKIRVVAVSLIFIAVSAVSFFAQTQQSQPFKIGVINTLAFDDDKTGITKYAAALNGVDAGFKKELDELNVMVTRMQTLERELKDIEKQLTATNAVPANKTQLQTTYRTKIEEVDKVGREYKFKQEDVRTRYQRRRQEVMGPILKDIGTAMQQFAKQKGYAMLLDAAKLTQNGLLLGLDERIDLTKDFITFYNARPATATVTNPVK